MSLPDVASKAQLIRDRVSQIAALPLDSYECFSADPVYLDAALHRLQVGIQALIDIGAIVVSHLALRKPQNSRDVIEVLEASGRIPDGSLARFGPLVGFRNRVVHLYERVDPEIVFRICKEQREDLLEFLDLLLAALDDQQS